MVVVPSRNPLLIGKRKVPENFVKKLVIGAECQEKYFAGIFKYFSSSFPFGDAWSGN